MALLLCRNLAMLGAMTQSLLLLSSSPTGTFAFLAKRFGRLSCHSCFRTAQASTMKSFGTLDAKDGGENNDNNILIHTVHWETSDKDSVSFKAYDGELLRTAALRRGIVSPHNGNARLINCRGLGTCGTCAIEIEDLTSASIDPPERNGIENARLRFPPHGSPNQSAKLRLACQVQIRGDVGVTKRTGFWGQNASSTEVAPASDAQTYFGELEFLLDRRSPLPQSEQGNGNHKTRR